MLTRCLAETATALKPLAVTASVTDARYILRNRVAARRCAALMAACLVVALSAAATISSYQLHAVARHGWVWWRRVPLDSPRLSPAMRLALRGNPVAKPGALVWQTRAPGFETADLPALVNGHEVDRLLLARIDPAKFSFRVETAPAGDKTLPTWMGQTQAVLIVNGSYYGHDGAPATPIRSAGRPLGPSSYNARSGAFVASGAFTGIRDLAHQSWQNAFANAPDALVSYPLLIKAGGGSTITQPSQWLANRSFIGQDRAGRVVIGTTADAFFTLQALSRFLTTAPLGLTAALNLDGGPVACQGISLGGFRRQVVGKWEFQTDGTGGHLLSWLYGDRFALPVVIVVVPK